MAGQGATEYAKSRKIAPELRERKEMKEFYNKDCMEGMKEYPDNYFDLAIVDPPYGGVTQGGYMTHNKGQRIGTGLANQKGYHAGLWEQVRPSNEYFKELFRVSKNQIIWGGELLYGRFIGITMLDCVG